MEAARCRLHPQSRSCVVLRTAWFPVERPGDCKLDVPVRIQYAAALHQGMSSGVVSYSEWVV